MNMQNLQTQKQMQKYLLNSKIATIAKEELRKGRELSMSGISRKIRLLDECIRPIR